MYDVVIIPTDIVDSWCLNKNLCAVDDLQNFCKYNNNNNNNGYIKCYFSGELIALSYKTKQNNNNYSGVNIELRKINRLKALCIKTKKMK